MKYIIFCAVILGYTNLLFAQNYQFTPVVDIGASTVISQGKTGTCWSFSTSSFVESEIERISGNKIDISEMYTVRVIYDQKAWNYVMRQGTAQFSEGGLAHDLMNAISTNGLVPQQDFTGLSNNETGHDHSNIVPELKLVLDAYIQKDSTTTEWNELSKDLLDTNLGTYIETFEYEGKTYTPLEFLSFTQLNPKDYVSLTSFTHKPDYSKFILNIPDNFSNGSFYNLPLDEYIDILDKALKNGYTVELDIDVSEPTFSAKEGVAVIPKNKNDYEKAMTEIIEELKITPEFRQSEFENYNTTDDHLMHITGIVKDQKGNRYYKVKNSWGPSLANGGYVYISEAFMRSKSISIMVHKDVIPKELKAKLEI